MSVEESAANAALKKPKKKKRKILLVVLIVVVVLLALFAIPFLRLNKMMKAVQTDRYSYDNPQYRDITSYISGSGTLSPADSYTVISLVSGEILNAGFEEGDIVKKDDVLYLVDSSNTGTGIERAENALNQSQRNYNSKLSSLSDLTVTAPISGTVSGITVVSGSKIGNGSAACTIEDVRELCLTEYYFEDYAEEIYAGMPATVSLPDEMMTLSGSVKEVSTMKRTSETGIVCFAVTVSVRNPGSLFVGETATCWLQGSEGEIYPSIPDDDGLDATARTVVYFGISGTVSTVYVRNGDIVSAGQTLISLTSDTLNDEVMNAATSLRDAELSLQSQYDALDNYTISAPISGTIVDKYYKEGENAETGKTLCTIFDLSSLTVTLNVDELDIAGVKAGQNAEITADAVPEKVYTGVVTKVGINGSVLSGVTTYPVTIRIDNTDGLLPGMNTDVSILVSESAQVLSVPADAVQTGSRVLVKTEDGTTAQGAPEGYAFVKVETGVSDEDYVEILNGLTAADSIAWIPASSAGTDLFSMMMGAAGGGTPSGGPGGPGRS